MNENELSSKIIGCAIEVNRQLGPGLLESIYEESLCFELSRAGLAFRRQMNVPVKYKSVLLKSAFRLDLIVEDKVVVECKAKSELHPLDKQQLLTYLRLTETKLGLLINFNVSKLIEGVKRVVNELPE